MNIHSRNALNGMAIANTDFTVTMANGRRRDGLTTGFTVDVPAQRRVLPDGVALLPDRLYQGITDANGDATIILTRDKGVGLRQLSIAPIHIHTSIRRFPQREVYRRHQPDVRKRAKMGHMPTQLPWVTGPLSGPLSKTGGEVVQPAAYP